VLGSEAASGRSLGGLHAYCSPACTLSNVSSSLFAAHVRFSSFQCKDALKRSRIGATQAPFCALAYRSIGVISIRPNRVLVVHLCLSFPSILHTRRHFGSNTKGSTVAVRTSMGERLTTGSC
jgi:hypothetical protein